MRQINGWIAGLLVGLFLGLAGLAEAGDAEGKATGSEGLALFDGKTLDGWQGDPVYWRVEDGAIVGEITPQTLVKRNTFLVYQGELPGDFELTLEYWISEKGNSGVNYRSVEVEGVEHALRGYQCDLDGRNRYTGSNYEERGRCTLASRGERAIVEPWPEDKAVSEGVVRNAWQGRRVEPVAEKEALKEPEPGQWHRVRIVARGGVLTHYINDQCVSVVEDRDDRLGRAEGLLGVQVHVGPPMKVKFRNIVMRELVRE